MGINFKNNEIQAAHWGAKQTIKAFQLPETSYSWETKSGSVQGAAGGTIKGILGYPYSAIIVTTIPEWVSQERITVQTNTGVTPSLIELVKGTSFWDIRVSGYAFRANQRLTGTLKCSVPATQKIEFSGGQPISYIYYNGNLVFGKHQDYVFEDNGDDTWSIGARNNLSGDVVLPQTYRNKPITTIKEEGFAGLDITSIYIPEGYTMISGNAFENCTQLKKVHLPDSLVEIGVYAFSECYQLAAVGFGNSPITIGDCAFADCKSLKVLHIPMVDTIYDEAFFGTGVEHLYLGLTSAAYVSDAAGFPRLKSFYIDWTTAESTQDICFPSHEKIYSGYWPFDRELKGLRYTDRGNDTVSVSWDGLEGAPAILHFPLTDRWGRPITVVGPFEGINVYEDNIATVKNIHVPMTVFQIASGAFSAQQNVDTFQFDCPWAEIGTGIFNGQASLHLIGANLGLKSIVAPFIGDRMDGQNTFIGWWFTHNVDDILEANRATPKNLACVTLVDGITSLSNEAFASSRVNEVHLPDSITDIGTKCFNDSSLSFINIPDSVTTIQRYAFSGTNLTSILIPNSVTLIRDYAFSGCRQLTTVSFSSDSSVSQILPCAFQNCTSLKTITIPESVESMPASVFDSTDDIQFIESINFDYKYWYLAVSADNTQLGGDGYEYTYEYFDDPRYQAKLFSGGSGTYYRTNPVIINGLTLQSDNKTIVANITNPNGCPLNVSLVGVYYRNNSTGSERSDTITLAKNISAAISLTTSQPFNSAIVTVLVQDYQGDGLTASLEIKGSGATDMEETTT